MLSPNRSAPLQTYYTGYRSEHTVLPNQGFPPAHKQPNCSHFHPLITLCPSLQWSQRKETYWPQDGTSFQNGRCRYNKHPPSTFTWNLCLLLLINNVEGRMEPPLSKPPGCLWFLSWMKELPHSFPEGSEVSLCTACLPACHGSRMLSDWY